jgi:hypothetical protein
MGFEGKITPDGGRRERFCIGEMPLDISNRFQAELAAVAYAKHHGTEAGVTPGNTVMLWWITKGFARAYGDYVVSHEAEEINLADEGDMEEVLAQLEKETLH